MRKSRFGRFPYIPLAMFSSHFMSVLGRETLKDQVSYLKNAALGRLQAFRMYGGIGMSAPSLHRDSTDSLIIKL